MQCDLEGISIYYESEGSGRPVVMLPGRPSDHGVMLRFMEPLFAQRQGWQRIYPDLPGTGRTPSAHLEPTHDQMLDTMLAFIDAVIPNQRFVLAGYSYGGYLARGILHHRPTLIDGLLLCAPQIEADAALAQLPRQQTLVKNPELAEQLGPLVDLIVVQSPRVVEASRTLLGEVRQADFVFNQQLEEAGPYSFTVDMLTAPFEKPTLILTARQDNLCGYRDAWDLLDNYPRATFAVIDQAGHFINIEQDALCRALIGEWLDRVEQWNPASTATTAA